MMSKFRKILNTSDIEDIQSNAIVIGGPELSNVLYTATKALRVVKAAKEARNAAAARVRMARHDTPTSDGG